MANSTFTSMIAIFYCSNWHFVIFYPICMRIISFHTSEESRYCFQVLVEEHMINYEIHVCDPRHCVDRDGADISRYFVLE